MVGSTASRSAFVAPALQTGSQVLPVQDNIRELARAGILDLEVEELCS